MNQPLIGLDKLLADSWNAMFKEWKPTLGWTLGITLVPALINIAFALPQIAEPELSQNVAYQLIAFILVWAASLYFMSGLFRYFLDKKKEVSVSFQDIVSLAWIGALTGLILIPAFLLFILPGIWLAVAFSMAMPIYLNEGKGGWQAMKKSYDIVKGRWWATLIGFLVPQLVYGIGVSVIFGLLFGALIAIASVPFSAFIYALEQGTDQATALAALGPIAMVGLPIALLVFIVLAVVVSVLLTLARISVWTNLYKSLTETASK
ncbi:hypothetical protein K8R04_00760 [Candidatus Uhrbacteria bacterium]|nr:hypothetical protein [Candidatus Uhrbacteria bacterium]